MSLTDFAKTPRTNVVASVLEFPQIDTNGMIRKMDLLERARTQGARDLPDTESSGFDAIEKDIVNEIESEGNTQFNAYLSHQKTYADRANDSGVQALVIKLGSIASDAETDFERRTRVGTGDLYARKRHLIDTEKEVHHGLAGRAADNGTF